ncbi:MAG: twin-arginine translocase TatA/TatE family subunit [Planctomycetes bacterium]|nr:twin-arginine translocase TatA/TatE family subunit [Planctomycetota bacterium]
MCGPESPLLLFGFPHGVEWVVIIFIALLLFGNRLPSVARSVGKGITEFKKGLKDAPDEGGPDPQPPATRAPEGTGEKPGGQG